MIRKASLLTALIIALMLPGMSAAAADKVEPPKDAVPLTAVELLSMYGGKSWDWGTGSAARFAKQDRVFTAVVTESWGVQYAEGRWRITDAGYMCMQADWVSAYGRFPGNTCFLHVAKDGVIYQRSLPDGKWQVFRHAKLQAGDPINALTREDLVSERFNAAKAAIAQQ